MAQQGFPKLSRLLNAKDFTPVFKNPEVRVSTPYILFLVLKTTLPNSRLGVVVSKKNVSKAVQRNRIKRVIRETFRKTNFDIATIDLVVLARKNLGLLSNQEIHNQLEKLVNELTNKISEH